MLLSIFHSTPKTDTLQRVTWHREKQSHLITKTTPAQIFCHSETPFGRHTPLEGWKTLEKRLRWRSAQRGHGVAAFRALLKCDLSFYLQKKKNITETFNSPPSMPEAIPWEQWLSNMGFYNASRPQEHIVYWQSYPLLEFCILSFIFQVWSSAAGSHTTDQRLHVIGPFILCSKAAWYPLVGITAAVFSSQQQTLCFMPVCVCFHCGVM